MLPSAGAGAEPNLSWGFVVDEQQGTKCTACVWEAAETPGAALPAHLQNMLGFAAAAQSGEMAGGRCHRGALGLGVRAQRGWVSAGWVQGWTGSAGSRGGAGQGEVGWQSCAGS